MYSYKVDAMEKFSNWHTVTKYWTGKDASGGPVIAYFAELTDAQEYADFKQKQLEQMEHENRTPMMSQREVKKEYELMLKVGDLNKPVIPNKVNCYRCSCGNVIKTIDVANGTTPFMIQCDVCDNMASSTMYRDIVPEKEPSIEWYRPTLEECIKMRKKPNVLEHILMGGLEMRKIKK